MELLDSSYCSYVYCGSAFTLLGNYRIVSDACAPKNKKTQAIGMLAIGTSLATILGLPLGRLVGQLVGWRITFAIIAALA